MTNERLPPYEDSENPPAYWEFGPPMYTSCNCPCHRQPKKPRKTPGKCWDGFLRIVKDFYYPYQKKQLNEIANHKTLLAPLLAHVSSHIQTNQHDCCPELYNKANQMLHHMRCMGHRRKELNFTHYTRSEVEYKTEVKEVLDIWIILRNRYIEGYEDI
jgi:hypothetical protein